MLFTIRSLCIYDLEYHPVDIQIDMRIGLGLKLIGSQSTKLRNSLLKIKTAILNTGLRFPGRRILIDLKSQADKIEGRQLELGMALGILFHPITKGNPQLKNQINHMVFIGEISPEGKLEHNPSFFNFLQHKRTTNNTDIPIIPTSSERYCSLFPGLEYLAFEDLKTLKTSFTLYNRSLHKKSKGLQHNSIINPEYLLRIQGQNEAKRAALIAAIGRHHILFKGPPGIGKSLLSKALTHLQIDLTPDELIEILARRSHTLAANLNSLFTRHYREVYMPATSLSLIGGGNPLRYGDMALAHRGVLMVDEIQDISKPLLNRFKYVLEEKKILIGKGMHQKCIETDFQLVATMNPLDYKGSEHLSKAMVERIDISVFMSVEPPFQKEVIQEELDALKADLLYSFELQAKRNANFDISSNSGIPHDLLKDCLGLTKTEYKNFSDQAHKLGLSQRGYHKTLRVARSIADLEHEKDLKPEHFLEALHYRWHKKSL